MVHFEKIFLSIFLVAIVVDLAEPARYRQRLDGRILQPLIQRSAAQQKRSSARQVAVTPYPSADQLKPEIPFEEGNQPDEVYGTPDEVYGPPELDQTPADQLPSEEAPREFAPNSDAEEFLYTGEKVGEQISRHTSRRKTSQKIISTRFVQKSKSPKFQPLAVAAAQVVSPSALPLATPFSTQSQQYLITNQRFANPLHYQPW